MANDNKRLLIKQIDKKLLSAEGIAALQTKSGWIRTLRQLLNISLEQVGKKLNISPQAVKGIELREALGTATVKSLSQVAEAMDMKLVYVFLPKDGSLEKLIERRAKEMARKIVMRSSTTMKLEDQENSKERIKEAIEEVAVELKRKMPSTLWD